MNKFTKLSHSVFTLALLFSFQISLSADSAQETPHVDYTQVEHPRMKELSNAVYWEQIELVTQLLDDGVPAYGIHPSGIHPLLRASTAGRVNMIRLLIAHGAHPNEKYDYRMFPIVEKVTLTPLQALTGRSLMGVSSEKLAAAVQELVTLGADPNQADDNGNTPLHLIARYCPNEKQMVESILDGGAHPFLLNNKGQTPREAISKTLFSSQIESPFKHGEKRWKNRIRMHLYGTTQPLRRKVEIKRCPSEQSNDLLDQPLPKWNGKLEDE